jgi:hypothetical protein
VAKVIRPLLVVSNDKLGGSVWHFDLPAVKTCPGRSKLCTSHCYARRSRFVFPQVQDRLTWCFEQSKRKDFAAILTDELYRKGVLLCRLHVSGDVYSPAYARKLLAVVQASPQVTFWMYTRSYRVPQIAEVLWELAACENFSLWLSADDETGYPPCVPERVRVAWMQTGESPEQADLVFATKEVRKDATRISLDLLCPAETDAGKRAGTTCSSCQFCWRE